MSYPIVGALMAALFSNAPLYTPLYQPAGVEFVVNGEAARTCGEYIQALAAERTARPPDAAPGTRYTAMYAVFVAVTDGFLTGVNYVDRDQAQLGKASDALSRMTWLENYCKANPAAKFVEGLEYLRLELIKKGT